jgi:hypothetical protein
VQAYVAQRFWERVDFEGRYCDPSDLKRRHGTAVIESYFAAGEGAGAERWAAEAVRYSSLELVGAENSSGPLTCEFAVAEAQIAL